MESEQILMQMPSRFCCELILKEEMQTDRNSHWVYVWVNLTEKMILNQIVQ